MINTPKYIQLGLCSIFLAKLIFYYHIFEIQIYLFLLRNDFYYVINLTHTMLARESLLYGNRAFSTSKDFILHQKGGLQPKT